MTAPSLAPDRRALIVRHLAVTAVIALSLPTSVMVEAGAVPLIHNQDLADMRTMLAPTLASIAWVLVAATAVCVLLGLVARRAIAARMPARNGDDGRREPVRLAALFLAASIPQIPALAATVIGLIGAPGTPVHTAVGVSTLGVLLIGADALRSIDAGRALQV